MPKASTRRRLMLLMIAILSYYDSYYNKVHECPNEIPLLLQHHYDHPHEYCSNYIQVQAVIGTHIQILSRSDKDYVTDEVITGVLLFGNDLFRPLGDLPFAGT